MFENFISIKSCFKIIGNKTLIFSFITILHFQVTMLYGSLVEAGGCLTAKFAEHFMENRFDERILQFLGALLNAVLTVFCIHLTGMYANPIVAWACTFNCGEVPHLAHFVVYWLAPLVAWNVADQFLGGGEEVEVEKKETKVE